jgi:alginate O-acetyltransferase complex protein AlgI
MDAVQFTSLAFGVFLAFVFAAYWCARTSRGQNTILVLASYFFYGWWDYRFCALILFSSLLDYFVGDRIHATQNASQRRLWLIVSLVSNLGLLAIFKYFGFFAENLQILAQDFGWQFDSLTLSVILPVGISFYTFQTLSYTIDIYRGQLKPSRNLIDYLAFVSFFPQLVAGPIERGKNLLPQFQSIRAFQPEWATDGCRLILWGFFKKIAIADPLSMTVDRFYGSWESATGAEMTLATICFAFQIYCDFSAYSDIAIGTARLFSVRLMRNFAYPYFSQSVSEFWRRWHISLSTWFRDYVYIPLGGNRCGSLRSHANIMVTFLLSGLWHGAAWTFVAWGGIHGAAISAQKSLGIQRLPADDNEPGGANFFPHPYVLFRMLLTFAIVCCGWVFFRAESFGAAVCILAAMIGQLGNFENWLLLYETAENDTVLFRTLGVLLVFVGIEWCTRKRVCPLAGGRAIALPVRWLAYTFLIWATLDLMSGSGEQPFVYFAF